MKLELLSTRVILYAVFFIGWLGSMVAFEIISGDIFDIGKEAEKLIEECEVTLPRNQTCELVAIPVKGGDE